MLVARHQDERIDYESIKADANELRCQAISEFWPELFSRAAIMFAGLQRKAAAHVGAWAITHPANLPRSRHRSG